MKKIWIFLLCAALLTSLAACDANSPKKPSVSPAGSISSTAPGIASANPVPNSVGSPENQITGSGAQTATSPVDSKINLNGKLAFSAQTVDGQIVDSGIFINYKLTMINIWGTLCKPCIEEMPDIQALYGEMKGEQVNVIGFVANVLGGDDSNNITQTQRAADAIKILDAKGVTYTNIVFDDAGTNQIYDQISGFPTTIFVDGGGNVIGSQVCGAKGKDAYKTEIENRLKETGQ